LKEGRPSIYFATHNRGKYLEAFQIAGTFGIRIKKLDIEKEEIQADNLVDIASHAAAQASKSTHHVVVSEDAGFFVDAFGGFPGPYSAYVFQTLGTEGILKLMQHEADRKSSFRAALAYCEPGKRPICFQGIVKGLVSDVAKGTQGFGFDPIFIPSKGDGRTFAEMAIEEKNLISHRATAFKQFSRWFVSKQKR
jgi:XTP/dITP diphosphohydrolase